MTNIWEEIKTGKDVGSCEGCRRNREGKKEKPKGRGEEGKEKEREGKGRDPRVEGQ